jgi:hypothetical protein
MSKLRLRFSRKTKLVGHLQFYGFRIGKHRSQKTGLRILKRITIAAQTEFFNAPKTSITAK